MPTEQHESYGRTFVRGAVWGAGFAIVTVPIGILLRRWLESPSSDSELDEFDNNEVLDDGYEDVAEE